MNQIREEFQHFLDFIVDPAAVVADDGKFIAWNEKFPKLLKCETLENRSCYEFTYPEDIDPDKLLHQQCITGQRNDYVIQKRYINSEEEIVWVRLAVKYVRVDGKGFAIATAQDITQDLKAAEIARFRSDLFHAIANKKFVLHYQPIVALRDFPLFAVEEGDIFAEEALVRWVTEEGLIYPDGFLPTLRMLGSENKLCEVVLDLGIERIAKTGKRTCLNIEPLTLSLDGFKKILFDSLERHKVTNLSLVILEIVESEATDDTLEKKLKVLSRNFLISLDDWGSRYNNVDIITWCVSLLYPFTWSN